MKCCKNITLLKYVELFELRNKSVKKTNVYKAF